MCHNELKSLAPRRAAKIAAAADSVNFGWRGGAPIFFRRRRRVRVPAGCGGGIQRLRGLVTTKKHKRDILPPRIHFKRLQ